MKTYSKETLIQKLKEIREKGWIKNNRFGNDGGVGNTLEDLLGIEENNLPLPNAAEWELKTQRINTSSLVTLFHLEPSPRAMKFVPSILLPKYGWSHKEAGGKYPKNEKSFRQTIYGKKGTDRGFQIIVDYAQRKVLVSFNSLIVSNRHKNWLSEIKKDIGLKELSIQPYWGFDDLIHKAGTKLHNCFFIEADVKREKINDKNTEFYHYKNIYMLKSLSTERFVENIDSGNIVIDFDARTGHNHGTKFRLNASHLKNLYDEIQTL